MTIYFGDSTSQDTAGPSAAATVRGWVQFTGTGTVAIRDDFNVSSITDVNTGHYHINWDTDMSNDSYAWTGTLTRYSNDTGFGIVSGIWSYSNTQWTVGSGLRIMTSNNGWNWSDCLQANIIAFNS